MIDSLLDYLETNGIGEVGVDLFMGELPVNKQNIVCLIASPSPAPNKSIPYYTQTIDVWAKFASYEAGMTRLQAVFDLLHREENFEIDGYHIYLAYALGMIDDLDRDSERNHLFKLSMSFVYRQGVEFS